MVWLVLGATVFFSFGFVVGAAWANMVVTARTIDPVPDEDENTAQLARQRHRDRN